MKHFLFALSLAILGMYSGLYARAQSVFVPRAIITDGSFDLSFEYNRHQSSIYRLEKKEYFPTKTHASLTGLYMSSDNGDELARCFFPNNKTIIVVDEKGEGDVGSAWISLIAPGDSDFRAILTMKPQRSVYGSLVRLHADLNTIFPGFFAEFKVPLITARHELKLKELPTDYGTTQAALENAGINNLSSDPIVRSVIDAFNQPDWRYGKLSPVALTKHGIDDVLFRAGFNFINRRKMFARIYADLILPMGERPTAEFLFEPVIGSKHFGIGAGITVDTMCLHKKEHILSLVADGRYHYRCSAPEFRSLDLTKSGPWSRYLNLSRLGDSNHPLDAINVLTRDVDVHPGGAAEGTAILHYQNNRLNYDFGCNLWYRDSERLEMNEKWNQEDEQTGVFYVLAGTANGPTASSARINQNRKNVTPDSTFIQIKESDFDLDSAAHKHVFTYKFFGNISANHTIFNFPALTGLGYSYEFATSNAAVSQWALYLRTAFQF